MASTGNHVATDLPSPWPGALHQPGGDTRAWSPCHPEASMAREASHGAHVATGLPPPLPSFLLGIGAGAVSQGPGRHRGCARLGTRLAIRLPSAYPPPPRCPASAKLRHGSSVLKGGVPRCSRGVLPVPRGVTAQGAHVVGLAEALAWRALTGFRPRGPPLHASWAVVWFMCTPTLQGRRRGTSAAPSACSPAGLPGVRRRRQCRQAGERGPERPGVATSRHSCGHLVLSCSGRCVCVCVCWLRCADGQHHTPP